MEENAKRSRWIGELAVAVALGAALVAVTSAASQGDAAPVPESPATTHQGPTSAQPEVLPEDAIEVVDQDSDSETVDSVEAFLEGEEQRTPNVAAEIAAWIAGYSVDAEGRLVAHVFRDMPEGIDSSAFVNAAGEQIEVRPSEYSQAELAALFGGLEELVTADEGSSFWCLVRRRARSLRDQWDRRSGRGDADTG